MNLSIFDEPNFRQRLKGNAFVESLAAELIAPDQAQLQKDIETVSDSDPLVHKLVMCDTTTSHIEVASLL